jgi:hypothetical protein
MNTQLLLCDGCGQPASSEHIARRLQRLEWATRYRPLHIGTVLLGASSPIAEADYLYSGRGEFSGEAKHVLAAAGVSPAGKSGESTLTEFQRGGFLLTHVLECPLAAEGNDLAAVGSLLQSRLTALLARIRRSLRPKRIVPISGALQLLLSDLQENNLGCTVVLDSGLPFALDSDEPEEVVGRLRRILGAVRVPSRHLER